MMDVGWLRTRRGRVVYRRPVHAFTERDAARILRNVLNFDPTMDFDPQTLDLLQFLFCFGFLPINLPIRKIELDAEAPDWFSILRSALYGIADILGVPEIMQEFARQLEHLVGTPKSGDVGFVVDSDFLRLLYEAQSTIILDGGGVVWRKQRH